MYNIVLILFILPFVCISQVSSLTIVSFYGGNSQCSGSLIHQRWILTAASCFAYGQISIVNVGFNSYGVERIMISPYYKHPDNDIALIRLNADVPNEILRLNFNNDNDYRGLTLLMNAEQLQGIELSSCAAFTSNYVELICALGQNCQVAAGTPILFNSQQVGLSTGTYDCGIHAQAFTRISRHTAWLMSELDNYGDKVLQ